MKFSVEQLKGGSRLGKLTELGKGCLKSLETPACFLYTKGGSAPYLTPDMLQKIAQLPSVCHQPLPSLVKSYEAVKKFEHGVGEFTNMQDYLIYLSVQDPAIALKTGYNGKAGVALWGKGGKSMVNKTTFMEMIEAFQPNCYQSLADSDTHRDSSRKRVVKSVDRTLEYLDHCILTQAQSQTLANTAIFGTVQGGEILDERIRSAVETSKRPVQGFVIDGLFIAGDNILTDDFTRVSSLLAETCVQLPSDKPRIMHGVFPPLTVMAAVELGIDLFDSSYPYIVTERNAALTFAYMQDMEKGQGHLPPGELYLKDTKYADDFSPIDASCSCYTCQKHSRAYLCHLVNTSELLAGVLLMLHNFHHYFSFFASIRESLKNDTFNELKQIIHRTIFSNDKHITANAKS